MFFPDGDDTGWRGRHLWCRKHSTERYPVRHAEQRLDIAGTLYRVRAVCVRLLSAARLHLMPAHARVAPSMADALRTRLFILALDLGSTTGCACVGDSTSLAVDLELPVLAAAGLRPRAGLRPSAERELAERELSERELAEYCGGQLYRWSSQLYVEYQHGRAGR